MSDPTRPVVAAFDLDGTLTHDGSVFRWLRRVSGNLRVVWAAAVRSPSLAWGAFRSGPAADRVKEHLFRATLSDRDEAAVKEVSRAFALDHLAASGRDDVIERLRAHLKDGHRVVLVSASPELYVDVVAQALGAHGAVATRLAVDPLGRLTGGYLGKNCRGEEKLRRLELWISDQQLGDHVELHAYGNSRGDRRMLAHADVAVDCGRLGRFGALRKFTRFKKLD